MGFNSAFKGLKLLKKNPGNGRLNNLNDPVLNVLKENRSLDDPSQIIYSLSFYDYIRILDYEQSKSNCIMT